MSNLKNISVIDQSKFVNPFRRTYELLPAAAYLISVVLIISWGLLTGIDMNYVFGFSFAMLLLGGHSLFKAYQHLSGKIGLAGTPVSFIDIDELDELTTRLKEQNRISIGNGFEWDQNHRQKLYEVLKLGVNNIVPSVKLQKLIEKFTSFNMPDYSFPGNYWIHGINAGKEDPQSITFDQWTGNSMFFGTTRAGKSVALRYFAAQAILRDEVTIVVDPKGDKSIEATLKKLAERMDKPFYLFHAARPSESARIDPLRNWSKPTELASRIASLIPATSANDPFTSFSWRRLNAIISAIVYMNSQPNIRDIKAYVELGVDELLKTSLEYHLDKKGVSYKANSVYTNSKSATSKLEALVSIYKALPAKSMAEEIDGLISAYEHPSEHAQKMIGSLLPVLSMLTSGELGNLLSPDPESDDARPILNLKNVISSKGILYIGLDGLSDGFVAGALGSIMLSDLTAVAGNIYNTQEFQTSSERQSINLFVDEASMVVNEPFLNLLNQGGGAGFKTTAFSQTFADFVTRLGSQEAAKKALGNFNNKFAMRSKDADTLNYIAGELPLVAINVTRVGMNSGSAGNDGDISDYTGGYSENISEQEVELFQPNLLPNLPNMEYIGIVAGGKVIKGRVPLLKD